MQRSSRPYVKTMTTALRGYLNFLAVHRECRPWLDRAIPTVPQWRLSALPRYLPAEDVERLISSCDLSIRQTKFQKSRCCPCTTQHLGR